MSERARRTIYAWVTDGWDPTTPPRSLPSVRVWGDVVLTLVSEMRPDQLEPPPSIRSTAVFGWPEPLPPEPLAEITASRHRVELIVDASSCATARIDLVHELFDPVTWRRIGQHLVDAGVPSAVVSEELTPASHPMSMMMIDQGRSIVESLPEELLRVVLRDLRPIAESYLDTWAPLDEGQLDASTEIIVPPAAVISTTGGGEP